MKQINKQEFDKLLKYNRVAALEMLRDNEQWLEEIEIRDLRDLEDPIKPRDQKYKIFGEKDLNKLFSKQDNILLPPYNDGQRRKFYAALIVCDVDYNDEIKRQNFEHWYFLGYTNFRMATFNLDTHFRGAFFEGDVLFERVALGSVAKSDFQNDDVVLRLLSKDIIKNTDFDPNRVYFKDSITNEGQLRKHLDQIRDIEIEPILAIWQQYLLIKKTGEMDFERANFNGTANFEKATFLCNMKFKRAAFNDNAYFGNGTKFEGKLSFYEATFEKLCDLDADMFGIYVDFTGAFFGGRLKIDWKKFCDHKRRYKLSPTKSRNPQKIIYDYVKEEASTFRKLNKHHHKIRMNLHAVKEMLHQISAYNGEDIFLYWYRIHERECNFYDKRALLVEEKQKSKDTNDVESLMNKMKRKSLFIVNFVGIYFRYYFLDKFILDFMTGYFTMPWRAFRATVTTIFLFGFFYCLPCSSITYDKVELLKKLKWSFHSIDNIIIFLNIY